MSFLNPKIRRTLIFDAMLFLLGLAGIYQLAERAGFNTTSDLEFHVSDSRRLVFERIINTKLDSVFMAHDTLVAIDIHPISSVDELEVVTDSREIGARAVMLISRSGRLITLTVPLKEFYSLSYILIALFVGAVFFFHGLFVLVKRPDDKAARVYHWVSIWAAIIIMTTWGRYTIEPLGLGYIVASILFLWTTVSSLKKGKPIQFSTKEYEILHFFIQHADEIVSRDMLLDEVWGYDIFPTTRTVDKYIKFEKKN